MKPDPNQLPAIILTPADAAVPTVIAAHTRSNAAWPVATGPLSSPHGPHTKWAPHISDRSDRLRMVTAQSLAEGCVLESTRGIFGKNTDTCEHTE
jgi:hypothetical protein